MQVEYKVLNTKDLTHFIIRDIRQNAVDELVERFKGGYNPSKPLTIVEQEGKLLVANGNHRLKALTQLDIKEVPCIIYKDADPYKLAVEGNADEDTYSPMDLFDWLGVITTIKQSEEGITQKQIGERIGWSRDLVAIHSRLIDNVVVEVLEIAKANQVGRITNNVTTHTHNFTENWFKTSGLYDLNEEYQVKLMDWFIKEKFKKSNKQVKEESDSLLEIQTQIKYVEDTLQNLDEKEKLIEAVKNGEYTNERLKEVIERYNEGAKNKAIFGVDSLEELRKLPDNSIDLVVTDPPYGVSYVPTRNVGRPNFQDGKEETLELLGETFKELKRVCKANAHIYVFTGYTNAFEVRELMKEHFEVQENWITWVKNNHTLCNFKQQYASKYEIIWFGKMENGNMRELNNECSPDVMEVDIPRDKVHDCQKPTELLKKLIQNSSSKGEVVLDPFMGSGSTLLAAAELDRYYIGFEIETQYEGKFKRALSELQ